MLSRFIKAFLPRSKCLLLSCLQSPSTAILEPKKIKSFSVSIFSPFICHAVMGLDARIIVFWMISFKAAFSLSSFTLIKRLLNSFLFSAIFSSGIICKTEILFLPVILNPACDSSSLEFCMMCFAYKLNNESDNILSCHTPFPSFKQLFHVRF